MGVHMASDLDSVFAPVLVSASDDGFHAPDISDLLPPVLAFEGTVLGVDRVMVIRLMICLVLVLCLVLYVTRAKLVPGRV